MTDRKTTTPRLVNARRVSTLTGVVALTAAGITVATGAYAEGEGSKPASVIEAEGEAEVLVVEEGEGESEVHAEGEGEGNSHAEGEGEAEEHAEGEGESDADVEGEGEGEGSADAGAAAGEGESEGTASMADDASLLTGLAFMEGHIRAGLALYEAGDLAAAKSHMGHPIEEKYEAVEAQLEQAGHGDLEAQIAALADATEAEAETVAVRALFDQVRATMEAVRASYPADKQVESLIELTRIAGAEYTASLADAGSVLDLHEYQDSWGFLRVVEAEAAQMAEADDETLADVGRAILEQVELTGAVYGDLKGEGTFDADASVIYGAAARMELAGLRLESGHADGDADASTASEGEGESH